MSRLELTLPDDLVEAIAQRVAAILEERQRSTAPEWVTLEEAAERLRLTPTALRKRAQRGTLPGAVKDPGGSRWLVDARALSAYTRAPHENGPAPRKRPGPGTGNGGSDA